MRLNAYLFKFGWLARRKPSLRRVFFGLLLTLASLLEALEVQGHRGTRGTHPENSLPSFQAAIEAGADVLELDLLTTQDGELVIHHDFFVNLNLCNYPNGCLSQDPPLIRSLTLTEVKQLDYGSKRNSDFPNQKLIPETRIPTLKELFELIQSSPHPNAKRIRLNLEIKSDPRYPEFTLAPSELAQKILDEVALFGFKERVYYSSFDPYVLVKIRKLDPDAKIGLLFSREILEAFRQLHLDGGVEHILKIASILKAEILSPDHTMLKNAAEVRSLQEVGFRIIPWTINDPERWAELKTMGVDGIITDYPKELLEFLKSN
jgi:glycerophosphoryl diester phosphodiesterase